jgi:hypothetical protein
MAQKHKRGERFVGESTPIAAETVLLSIPEAIAGKEPVPQVGTRAASSSARTHNPEPKVARSRRSGNPLRAAAVCLEPIAPRSRMQIHIGGSDGRGARGGLERFRASHAKSLGNVDMRNVDMRNVDMPPLAQMGSDNLQQQIPLHPSHPSDPKSGGIRGEISRVLRS